MIEVFREKQVWKILVMASSCSDKQYEADHYPKVRQAIWCALSVSGS